MWKSESRNAVSHSMPVHFNHVYPVGDAGMANYD